jgi:hypothetical protein
MLRPEERQHLLELLRPPAGCKLDVAVGTTYSLDLISALMLPLSFAFTTSNSWSNSWARRVGSAWTSSSGK